MGPGRVTIDRIVSAVDLQPTLLGLLGVEPSGREQGADASPLLRGEDFEWSDESFLHNGRSKWAAIFTPRFELALVKEGGSVLFDRVHDPDQVEDLFSDAGHRSVVRELTRRIVDHHVAVGSPAAEWLQRLPG